MQNNALTNINRVKIQIDTLNTQITTGSKITRPSDDPVVAIRALSLRTDVSEITQYYEKNIPDAKSWLEVTESALETSVDILTSMYTSCVSAVSATTAEDRMKILEDLSALRDEIYVTGDADYAGRSIFTGYRTNESLSFQSDTTQEYTIYEQLTQSAIEEFNYIEAGDLYDSSGATVETDVAQYEGFRIRLAYDNLDDALTDGSIPTIEVPSKDENGDDVLDADGNIVMETLQINSANVVTQVYNSTDDPSPYELVTENPDMIYFVPDTGELLIGANVKTAIDELSKTDEVRISYSKSDWEDGDLQPQHYFACTSEGVEYNMDRLQSTLKDLDITNQYISYDVGFDQDIQINTLASECYTHDIGRDIDELLEATQQAIDLANQLEELEAKMSSSLYTDEEKADFQLRYDATSKAYEYVEAKSVELFESAQTSLQGYIDQANLAITNVGSRYVRVELIESRLQSQQTTFTELADENEGADLTTLAIQLASAELTYEASLLTTSKILSTSLMNFI